MIPFPAVAVVGDEGFPPVPGVEELDDVRRHGIMRRARVGRGRPRTRLYCHDSVRT